MYALNALIMYGVHGVCKIIDTETRMADGKQNTYYVLAPIDQPAARFYVPQHNDAAMAKMHPLVSKDELVQMLQSNVVEETVWLQDEGRRKQRYKEIIGCGDRSVLISMVQLLYRQRKLQLAAGRKFHLCDENFLRDALRLIVSETAAVLEMSQEEAREYVQNLLAE